MNKKPLIALAIAAVALLGSATVFAQDHSRTWENGAIVAVTEVHVKPGMFNAYINDLNNLWRKFVEAQMEEGDVLAYNIFSNTSAREGEPDLYLSVTYKNWAAFDRGVEYFEDLSKKLMGSLDELRDANIDREELRAIGSTFILQEIKFKD